MLPVLQNDNLNCMGACVASVLHLDQDQLPGFLGQTNLEELDLAYNMILKKYGYYLLSAGGAVFFDHIPGIWIAHARPLHPLPEDWDWGDAQHAVVMRGKNVIHDPSPLPPRYDEFIARGMIYNGSLLIPLEPRVL